MVGDGSNEEAKVDAIIEVYAKQDLVVGLADYIGDLIIAAHTYRCASTLAGNKFFFYS